MKMNKKTMYMVAAVVIVLIVAGAWYMGYI